MRWPKRVPSLSNSFFTEAGVGEKRRGLTARVQRVPLGQRDHLLHQRLDGLGLGNGGDDALFLDDAGHQAAQQRFARADDRASV